MPTRGELLSIAIRFQLGELISDELPGMAATLLAERLDTPSLREVAGDLHPTMAEAGAVFSRALAELGVALTHEEAALLRAEEVAGSILRGECSPDSGASEIYYLQRHHGALPQLDGFLNAYWRLNDDERTRADVLRAAARTLVTELRATVAVDAEPLDHGSGLTGRG